MSGPQLEAKRHKVFESFASYGKKDTHNLFLILAQMCPNDRWYQLFLTRYQSGNSHAEGPVGPWS